MAYFPGFPGSVWILYADSYTVVLYTKKPARTQLLLKNFAINLPQVHEIFYLKFQ